MDKSDVYLNMVDCPEIQVELAPTVCIYNQEGNAPDHDELSSYISPYVTERVINKKGQNILKYNDDRPSNPYYVRDVFTPTQDQIQQMLLEKFSKEVFVLHNTHNGSKLAYLIGVFKDFVHNKCEKMIPLENNRARIEYFFTSMEQLWLAFYMHEKHNKTWNGKSWKNV